MVAMALQADGWWLRQDIIWAKPNPMPESVRDRCTKAHEYVFLLTKSAKYFYNADAIKELSSEKSIARYERGRSDSHKWADGGHGNQTIAKSFDHMRDGIGRNENDKIHGNIPGRSDAGRACNKPGRELRNKRSVWTVATQPTPEAHFATFPITLPETCLLAGSRPGGIVLDPFSGAGTTGLAALKNGRRYVGIELNPEYIDITRGRFERKLPALTLPKGAKKPNRPRLREIDDRQICLWGEA